MESEIRLENIVIGQTINQPEDFDELAQYVPNGDVFIQGKARRLWEMVGSMLRDDKPVTLITVIARLTSYDEDKGVNTSYVVDVTSAAACSTGVKDVTHAKLMYEKYLLRKVMGEAQRIESLARNNTGEVYEAIEDAHRHLGQILELKPDKNFSIDKELLSAISSITDKDSLLLKTGYDSLDSFAGGLTRGEITIIGGRPGHGKTTFMINLLSRMIHSGLRIAFFSRELPNSELLVNDYKWVAKENKCAVVLASQLNRAIETRPDPIPQLSDLAESGAIEQVAENVFFVFYPHKVTPDKSQDNLIEIRAAKVRYGETGKCVFGFDGDKAKMYGSLEELVDEKRNKKRVKKDRTIKTEEDDLNLPF